MIFPKLVKFDCPTIKINNRFTRSCGINYSEKNQIDLAGKFFAKNHSMMLLTILPHELAHQIDFNLNGWNKGDRHHRESWKRIMILLGQSPQLTYDIIL